MDELEYITVDALMMCDMGGAPDFFKPTYNTTVKIHGCLVATNKDAISITNIPSFKVCKITKGRCTPATQPMTWKDTWQVKIKGVESLIGKSTCPCKVGGKIEFMTSGQVPLPPDAAAEVKDLQDQSQRELDDAGLGDSVGETGFVEGMIPVWGSGRDLVNDIQTGDVGGAILNAGFLIWDVASVVAGVFSFGAATVAMQGAKTGVKATIHAGAKVIAQSAMKGLGKAGFNKLTKEALEKSVKELREKLLCALVRACFTGDTLIHTSNGLKPIKDIQIGDEVYSYEEDKGQTVLKTVTHLFEEEVAEILELHTEHEILKTTRNHPFYINGAFKDAGQIEPGEHLLTREGKQVKVLGLNYLPERTKVYNFEVEDCHCYFVGGDGVLVLNTCPGLLKRLSKEVPDKLKDIFKCKEFAAAYKELLQREGVNGAEVILRSDTGFIFSESLGRTITTNGTHVGIKVDNLIFDNLNPNGIPYERWLDDLGAGFPGMNPPTINPF